MRTPYVITVGRLTQSGALHALIQAFEQQLREAGYLAMGGQIVDASLIPALKQRGHAGRKGCHPAGKSAKQIWPVRTAQL